MTTPHGGNSGDLDLLQVVVLLGAAVVMVPLFRRFALGSVLGYLAAGLAIGPFGFAFFKESASILHVAELGVVMFLFVIGLEMRPTHLWHLRREIFGLGALQTGAAAIALTCVGLLYGYPLAVSFIGAAGFVLTSTAIVMQFLGERGDIALPPGQKMVSILLFEDLLIVPLLALVAFLSPEAVAPETGSRWMSVLVGVASLAGLIAVGFWFLNPLFRILAAARAREVMTAAALLVVLGSALLMERGGLSMAMGAFIAGVLLSESSFRHQLEADIEPFRGLLLGLFFLAVGMSLDLAVVAANWAVILTAVLAMMAVKSVVIYFIARFMGSKHPEALDRALLMAQGGEFAFVLFSAATAAGIVDAPTNANLTAIVVLSMVLTPIVVIVAKRYVPAAKASMEGVTLADGLSGSVLIIGFGRFGQVVSQALLARGVDVSIIDTDVEMITSAEEFGFKVYYGDGTRLDVLRASGAGSARAIAICIDDKSSASHIVELLRAEFPLARVLVRAFDRGHARELLEKGVDFQIRETFESALQFGEAALLALDVDPALATETIAQVRRRDAERFQLEVAGGGYEAGRDLMLTNAPKPDPKPVPFTPPRRPGQVLNAPPVPVTGELSEQD